MTTAARRFRSIIITAALAGTGFLGGSIARARWLDAPTTVAPARALAVDHAADLIAGPDSARVTIRIFGDYQCDACRQLDRTLGDTLLAAASAGHIRLVYLHRPLATRRDADVAAATIACTPAERRWSLHRRLYQTRAQATLPPASSLVERVLHVVGADTALLACAHSDTMRAHARASIAAARAAGFHEVPTVLVNDRQVHFRTYPALLRYIEHALARPSVQPADPHSRPR